MKSEPPTAIAEAAKIAGEFLEQARAAAARGENLTVLGLAHLRAAMVLFALNNPQASAALSHAVEQSGATLGLVSQLTRAEGGDARQ